MFRYPFFGIDEIPPVVKNLFILNGFMFLVTLVVGQMGIDLTDKLGLFYMQSDYFHPYQFVTHMFMHAPGLQMGIPHLLSNMIALWLFGSGLEKIWGPQKFLFYYFFCGLGAAAIHSFMFFIDINYIADPERVGVLYNAPTVGASGAVYGVLIGFGLIFPNAEMPFIPIPVKFFVFIYAVAEFFAGLGSLQGGSSIAHFAHLGGMLFGFILISYWGARGRKYL